MLPLQIVQRTIFSGPHRERTCGSTIELIILDALLSCVPDSGRVDVGPTLQPFTNQ